MVKGRFLEVDDAEIELIAERPGGSIALSAIKSAESVEDHELMFLNVFIGTPDSIGKAAFERL